MKQELGERSRHNNGLLSGWQENRSSIPCKENRFSPSSQRPERLCVQPNLLFVGNGSYFSRGKAARGRN
jgi:hypothetical protein